MARVYYRDSKGRFASRGGGGRRSGGSTPSGGRANRRLSLGDSWSRTLAASKRADRAAGGGAKGTIAGVRAGRQKGAQLSVQAAAKAAGAGRVTGPRTQARAAQLRRVARAATIDNRLQRATTITDRAYSRPGGPTSRNLRKLDQSISTQKAATRRLWPR